MKQEYYLAFNQLYEFFTHKKFKKLISMYGGDIEKAWKERQLWSLEEFSFKNESLGVIKSIIARFDLPEYFKRLTKLGINYLTIESDDYPEPLRQVRNPPLVIYYKGNIDLLKGLSIAVVGTRLITLYGEAGFGAVGISARNSGKALVFSAKKQDCSWNFPSSFGS
jgi:predicted Rossmann fold nucleotide-binding protein DprA/Smf involved in DNA uptake